MFKITALITLVVINVSASEIKSSDLTHLKKSFGTIYGQKKIKIDDPITEKGPNRWIHQLLDKNGKHLGWWRPIVTDTGCKSACLSLNFSLLFDLRGNFIAHFSPEVLTKKNHRLFKESDNMKLDLILHADGPGLDKKLIPMDLIDAITMATQTQFKDRVVPDAALTTFRMLQYKRHSEQWIKRYIVR